MHYLLLLLLILLISYLFFTSLKLRRKIIVRAEVSSVKKISILIAVVLFFLLAFLLARDNIVLYLLSSLASVLFIFMTTSQGLTKDGLVYFRQGKGVNTLKEVFYEELDSVEFVVLEEFIILNYSFQEDYGQQIFSSDKKEKVSQLIRIENM